MLGMKLFGNPEFGVCGTMVAAAHSVQSKHLAKLMKGRSQQQRAKSQEEGYVEWEEQHPRTEGPL